MTDTILIVDDDEDFCQLLSKSLAHDGYHASWTTKSSVVPELLEKVSPFCVLLDLKLSDADGLEVLHRIQKLDRTLPVIILTGFESIRTAVQAIQEGAFHYLPKPPDEKELGRTLKKALKQRRLHQKIPELKKNLDQISLVFGRAFLVVHEVGRVRERIGRAEQISLDSGTRTR